MVDDIDTGRLAPPPESTISTKEHYKTMEELQLDSDEQKALGKKLREAREYIGLLQKDVARALGIPRASVSAIENGKRRVSSLELRRFGRLYRRPVAWLLGEESAQIDKTGPLYRATESLSAKDREQVLRFAEFLAGAGRPGVPQTREPE